jgi:hypothetical protein
MPGAAALNHVTRQGERSADKADQRLLR